MLQITRDQISEKVFNYISTELFIHSVNFYIKNSGEISGI